jgi:hypothetical protein
MTIPDPEAAATRAGQAAGRAAAAAERLRHAEERLDAAREQLAATTDPRETESYRQEIASHQRAVAFHRKAVEDQTEAARLFERHRQVDEEARAAGSMSAVLGETDELLREERAHSESLQRHANHERALIDDAIDDVERRRTKNLS